MKNIYIVGFMGTGKTVVGKILAKRLDRDFVEMDEIIEQQESMEISDIFAQKGEAYSRKLEKGLLLKLSGKENLIISCGGGLICNEENKVLLKATGIVISLSASASTIYERTKKYTHRPLLNVNNPQGAINDLLNKRTHFYSQAHYVIDTEDISADEVADMVIEKVNNG